MTIRTFGGNTFGGWSFRGLSGAGVPSRALDSSVRQQGAIHLMTQTCDIERPTLTNVDGEFEREWETIDEDCRCLVQEKKGGRRLGPDGRLLAYDAVGFLPINTDIKPQGASDIPDRLIWKTIDPPVVFSVVLATDESGMLDHLTVYLQRLPDPAGTEE